ncbi:efflux RND transporter permease subunit [Saccharopolyspora spinosa]|uniref:HAE1 family hydrophobic/amphiphilic exporter-1 n=1 Tax=Saccharopolyspora spinosa TaxID=60894 RepID=A0A2N3XQY1_SACSN|nr:efflux RND transporter permease subunit [Saccharopolyspora spinosa]PKW13094.1 HAE1 family hydrophobic/amphiphilic exporter-1 [Saccharopolyspora spinosa]
MSALARLSLVHRSLVALIALVVAGFGAVAVPALKQQLLPPIELPMASVVAAYPGASPEVVEQQVTVPLEDSLRGVPGITGTTSTSRESSASVRVEFEYGTDIDAALGQLQRSVSRIESQLPEGVEPQVVAGSTADLPVVTLAATSPGDQQQLAARLDGRVVPELEGIDGVRDASVSGTRQQIVTIAPDNAKLAAAGLSPSALSTALRAAGSPVPGGTLTEQGQTLIVQTGHAPSTVEDLRNLYLSPSQAGPRQQPVRLGDVAEVTAELAAPTSLTRTNGQPSLGVSVTMKPDGNAVTISHEVRDRLPELTTALGPGAALTVVFDQAPAIEKSIESVTTEGLLGLVMAVVVILVFLLSIRSTLVTAVSIPLSVLIALIALWTGDLSLNMLTLGALTIAVGRVVDDSIVVLENIKRHLSYGEDKRRAVLGAVREVAGAVTASTLTTVAVFLPIALVGGMVGQLFNSFAITVTVALLASLLVSLTVIPVLAYWFLPTPARHVDAEAVRREAEEREQRSLLQRVYVPVIAFATRFRWSTVAIAVVILIGTLGLVPLLQTNFLSPANQNTLRISQQLPAGSSLEATDAAAQQLENVLADFPEIESYQVSIGGAGGPFGAIASLMGGGSGASTASFSLTLAEDADSTELSDEIRNRLAGLTDAGKITLDQDGGGVGGTKLQVIVQGSDQTELAAAADAVQRAMSQTPGVSDVSNNLGDSAPRIDVNVRDADAARYGLTEATIGQAVAQAMQGTTLTQLTIDGTPHDVVLRGGDAPAGLDELRALPLPTATGTVRLDRVADVGQVDGPQELTRTDRDRSVTVSGNVTGADLGATTADLRERLAGLDLPAGATYEMGGVSADQEEAFGQLGLALAAAIAIVFLIMVGTFRSLVQPLVLLVSVPFAATGAIGLLLVTGTPLGVPALIGMLMLVGIVVTNAIVLVDLINQYRADGASIRQAVIDGGRRRLRPILMTAAATIFALLPMAIGITGGDGGFIGKPLAIVVIGGLVSSTLLTLVLVPTLYTVVETVKENARHRREQRRARAAANGAAEPAAVLLAQLERENAELRQSNESLKQDSVRLTKELEGLRPQEK